jgi:copper resistance protein B
MRASLRAILALTVMCLLNMALPTVEVFAQTIAHPSSVVQARTQLGTMGHSIPRSDWPSPVEDRNLSFVLADVLEYRPKLGQTGSVNDFRWDIEGWYGGDYNRLWFKSEGQQNSALKADYDIDFQLLYGRFIQQYYDVQIGGSIETQSFRGRNVTRSLAVIGLQGLVPYNYEIESALFISHRGDVSTRVTATKDLLLSQRLILQLRLESNVAIQRVRKFTTGSGLNNLEGGVRLRYEIRREFAPYIGVSLDRSFGETATLVREEDGDRSQIRFVLGVRVWF